MNASSLEYLEISSHLPGEIEPGLGRSAMDQALYQIAGLGVSLALALVGGLITGKEILHLSQFTIRLINQQYSRLRANLFTRTI